MFRFSLEEFETNPGSLRHGACFVGRLKTFKDKIIHCDWICGRVFLLLNFA